MAGEQSSQESTQCGWCAPEGLAAAGRPDGFARRLAPQLVRVVEGEMVPRLLLMRPPAPAAQAEVPARPGSAFTAEHVQELVRLLVTHESLVASAYVDMFRDCGASVQEICLNLLPAAARRLGELWEEDRCGFAQVTMGVCSLHQVLHRLTADQVTAAPQGAGGRGNRVLLSNLPGEQHNFGLLVVAQFLRRDGWDVAHHYPNEDQELIQSVRKKSFTIIGLSIGRHCRIRDLTLLIKALRRASVNPRSAVIVGGPLLLLQPQIARQVGADATAMDAQETATWARGCWQSNDRPDPRLAGDGVDLA
jgi:methanogenic corrinoid protein MtbC1